MIKLNLGIGALGPRVFLGKSFFKFNCYIFFFTEAYTALQAVKLQWNSAFHFWTIWLKNYKFLMTQRGVHMVTKIL